MSHTGSVLGLLRKALVVSTKLSIKEVQAWVKSEIEGYKGDVPEYRQFGCQLKVRNPFNGWQPVRLHASNQEEADFFKLLTVHKVKNPIAEVETWLAKGGGSIGEPLPDSTANDLGIELPIAQFVATGALAVIPDRIRSYILEWSLDLEQKGILGNGMTFTTQEKAQALNVTTNNFYAPQYQNNGQVGSMGDSAFAKGIRQKIASFFKGSE